MEPVSSWNTFPHRNAKIFQKMTNKFGEHSYPMNNFWQTLEKPIFILAPMEEVTDTVLRQVIARYGKPTVFFTEFTDVGGMFSKGEIMLSTDCNIPK